MQGMYGADADELEAFATELDRYRDELNQLLKQGVGAVSLVGLSATINTIWRGPRASEFSAIWQSRHLLQVLGVQELLARAVTDLRANATAQRVASARTAAPAKRQLTPYEEQLISSYQDALGRSEADLVKHWAGLDEFERRTLTELKPEWVLSLVPLGALTPAEIEAARQSYRTHGFDDLELTAQSTELWVEAEVTLKAIRLSAEASATITEVVTGTGSEYKVTFAAEGEIGLTAIGKAKAGFEGGGTLTYTFHTYEEADRFARGLAEAMVPNDFDDLVAYGFGRTSGLVAAKAADVALYLNRYTAHVSQARLHGGVQAALDVDAGPVEGVAKFGAGAYYDIETGERGLYLDLHRQIERELLDIGPIEVESDRSVQTRAELRWDNEGRPKELFVEIDLERGGGADLGDVIERLVGPVDDLTPGVEGRGTMNVLLDLSNPRNRQLAQDLANGYPGALPELLQSAEVAIQVGIVGGGDYEVDLKAAKVAGGVSHYGNLITVVKPPHSGFERIER